MREHYKLKKRIASIDFKALGITKESLANAMNMDANRIRSWAKLRSPEEINEEEGDFPEGEKEETENAKKSDDNIEIPRFY